MITNKNLKKQNVASFRALQNILNRRFRICLFGGKINKPIGQKQHNTKLALVQVNLGNSAEVIVILLCPNWTSSGSSQQRRPKTRAAWYIQLSSFCCLGKLIGLKIWLSLPLCIHAWIHWYKCKHMFRLPTPPTNTHASHSAINRTNIKDKASPFCAPREDFGIYGTSRAEHLQPREKPVTVTDYYHTNSQISF